MRQFFTVVAVLIGCGIGLGVASHDAEAGPVPAVSAPVVAQAVIEKTGYWKRRWRNGYGPDVVLPDADVDVDVDVTVPGETPPVIAIVPVRPVSCGEYRYWDGERCVDARYNNPYVGPR
jgi:hypothetical protein